MRRIRPTTSSSRGCSRWPGRFASSSSVSTCATRATSARRSVGRAAGALLALTDPLFAANRNQVADVARRHRIPTMVIGREYVEAGGLVSYGFPPGETWRLAASYVDKILKGAKPADLPVEQPTKFELVVNLRTAKALGLTIPHSILVRADQVIE